MLVAAASAVGMVTVASLALSRRRSPRTPLTVRALLASDELTDLTTDNLMALHRGSAVAASGREHLRDQVFRGFQRIDGALAQLHPEAHEQLGALELNGEQKEAALGVVRKFGDERMVRLGRALSSAAEENDASAGDDATFKRRLIEVLRSRLGDVMQLNAEMFPEGAQAQAPLGKWHPEFKVDFGGASDGVSRRLMALDGAVGGVNAHAQALFESLERLIPDRMPKAPARMLSMFGGDSAGTAGGTDEQKQQKFMDCIKAAVPDPSKTVKCIADNLEHVVKMVMGFLKGKVN